MSLRRMDRHVKDFYQQASGETPKGHFHKVIPLHNSPDTSWDEAHKLVPNLCRGWYELSHLNLKDRIEFSRDFWISKLPYRPNLQEFISRFFDSIEDIAIFIVQQKFEDPFEAHLVYSLKNEVGFYRGYSPATETEIVTLQNSFPGIIFPRDYLAFLQIHNGFCKTTDSTGVTHSGKMLDDFEKFQAMLAHHEQPVVTTKGQTVNPKALIPFYESFGMPFYQCFWTEWYPEEEMGNVYYSGNTRTISDVTAKDLTCDTMAFPTFSDWLMFYLETIT